MLQKTAKPPTGALLTQMWGRSSTIPGLCYPCWAAQHKLLPTLNAKPLSAVLWLLAQALAVLPSVSWRWCNTFPNPQMLALRAAHRPFTPHLPVSIHWMGREKKAASVVIAYQTAVVPSSYKENLFYISPQVTPSRTQGCVYFSRVVQHQMWS